MADHRHEHEQITCREFVEVVTDYLEGALPEHRRDLIEEHIVMCDWCKTYLDQMEATVDALGTLPPEPVPDDAREALLMTFRTWKAER